MTRRLSHVQRDAAPLTRPARAAAGFTLIEVMIVVVIVGVLAAVAYPSYQKQVRASRRADATLAIAQVQQAQERWRASNAAYASALTTLNVPAATSGGYYTVSTAVVTGNQTCPDATTKACSAGSCYSVTATAVTGKSQNADTGCTSITSTWLGACGGSVTYTPAACWSK